MAKSYLARRMITRQLLDLHLQQGLWKDAWKRMVYLPGRSRSCGCFVVLLSSLHVAISKDVISWVPRVVTMVFFVARGGNFVIVALYVGARRAKRQKRRIPYPPPKT
jgi:hypothetical protein